MSTKKFKIIWLIISILFAPAVYEFCLLSCDSGIIPFGIIFGLCTIYAPFGGANEDAFNIFNMSECYNDFYEFPISIISQIVSTVLIYFIGLSIYKYIIKRKKTKEK